MDRDWLTIKESRALLYAIFPNYPDLNPCLPAPPRDQWHNLPPAPEPRNG